MQVRLITQTEGIAGTEYENKSVDEIIVGIARVSSTKLGEEKFASPEKLLRYCLLNGHWSIFEMANLTFELTTSRFVSRQLLRHWSLKPQEFSQRYAEQTAFEPVELRYKAGSNRQSSTNICLDYQLNQNVADFIQMASSFYTDMVQSNDIAPETAREILPECAQSKIIFNGTVRSWITTLNQRLHQTSQKECREVAEAIKILFIQVCPIISKALFDFEYADKIHILDRLILEKYKVANSVIELIQRHIYH